MGWIHGGDDWHQDGRGEVESEFDKKLKEEEAAERAAFAAEREVCALKAAHEALEKATSRILPTFENVDQLRKLVNIFKSATVAHPEILGTLQKVLLISYQAYEANGGRNVDRIEWLLEAWRVGERFVGGKFWDFSPNPRTRAEAEEELEESKACALRLRSFYGKDKEFCLVAEEEYLRINAEQEPHYEY